MPIDIVYSKDNHLLYVADMMAYSIYIYDTNFEEIDRIKLPIRPYKLSLNKNILNISPYDYNGKYCKLRIDLNTKIIEADIYTSNKESDLAKAKQNTMLFSMIDENSFFAIKQYPSFNIFKIENDSIRKIFCDPVLFKKKLPYPELKIFDNEKKHWTISPYIDIKYNQIDKLLFTLTTVGWPQLQREYNLKQYIVIYDSEGVSLCRFELPNQKATERSKLNYDSNTKILYCIYDSYIIKYKVIPVNYRCICRYVIIVTTLRR